MTCGFFRSCGIRKRPHRYRNPHASHALSEALENGLILFVIFFRAEWRVRISERSRQSDGRKSDQEQTGEAIRNGIEGGFGNRDGVLPSSGHA
jgi:hypothetical protein